MRRVLFAIIVALVFAPAADATLSSLSVCGPSGCRPVAGHAVYDSLLQWESPQFTPPPALGVYYELRSTTLSPNSQRAYFVPSGPAIKADFVTGRPDWMQSEPDAVATLEAAIPDLEPFPAPTISSAFVGPNPAADPARYEALFDRFPSSPAPPPGTKRLSVALRSTVPSPWTDGYNALQYVPGRHLLHRGNEWVRLPDELGEQLDRDARLLPPAGSSDFPWGMFAGLAGGLLILAGVGLVGVRIARRRPRAREA
jgi:hypothetical protein